MGREGERLVTGTQCQMASVKIDLFFFSTGQDKNTWLCSQRVSFFFFLERGEDAAPVAAN